MKRLRLIIVILIVSFVFTGCSIIFTVPDCCPPPTTPPITPPVETCTLTVTAGYWVWGIVYYRVISTGQIVNTGKYIDYDDDYGQPTATVYNMPCGERISVYIVDNCNNCGSVSHEEIINVYPGDNYLYFAYWKINDKSIDFHQR